MIDKTCPIKRADGQFAVVKDKEGRDMLAPKLRCNGPACAWYDERREQCAVLTACLGVGKK